MLEFAAFIFIVLSAPFWIPLVISAGVFILMCALPIAALVALSNGAVWPAIIMAIMGGLAWLGRA